MSTLVFLEAGLAKYLNDPELNADDASELGGSPVEPLISFQKCRKIATVISDIQMYQHETYSDFQPHLGIRVSVLVF